jgi:hypothetical protein
VSMASFYISMLLGRNRDSFRARAGQGRRRRREGDGSGRDQNVTARTPAATPPAVPDRRTSEFQ